MTPNDKTRAEEGGLWTDLDPVQIPVLEALRRIGEPLSAIELVNVLDGYVSMWEAKDHLEALHEDGVVEPDSAEALSGPVGEFDLPYRLRSD